MSKGTFVLQTDGEYRVAQVEDIDVIFEEQCPDTLQWSPNKKAIVEAFGKSKIYGDLGVAWDSAELLEKQHPTDVGSSLLRQFARFKWEDFTAE
jgi:hypothetical protein